MFSGDFLRVFNSLNSLKLSKTDVSIAKLGEVLKKNKLFNLKYKNDILILYFLLILNEIKQNLQNEITAYLY